MYHQRKNKKQRRHSVGATFLSLVLGNMTPLDNGEHDHHPHAETIQHTLANLLCQTTKVQIPDGMSHNKRCKAIRHYGCEAAPPPHGENPHPLGDPWRFAGR